jgi:hypothetical protein
MKRGYYSFRYQVKGILDLLLLHRSIDPAGGWLAARTRNIRVRPSAAAFFFFRDFG